jgi:hypothetical protein
VSFFHSTCIILPEYCHDENWFVTSMNSILESKFHIGRQLPFAFIDSWAKHPLNLGDEQQQAAFARETSVLWEAVAASEDFFFKSVQDILVKACSIYIFVEQSSTIESCGDFTKTETII